MSKNRIKISEEKIQKAIDRGELIPHEKIMASYSIEKKERILERARYLRFAMQLRELRKQKKLSQAALARKMRVKREFISRIESGRQNMTLETLYRIAEVTGKELQVSFN